MTASKVVLVGTGQAADAMEHWLVRMGDEVIRIQNPASVPEYLSSFGDGEIAALLAIGLSLGDVRLASSWWEDRLASTSPIFVSALTYTVTEVAGGLLHPNRVAGIQPWGFETQSVLEISRPLQAEDETVWGNVLSFWRQRHKQVEAVEDAPGFVFPRILSLLVNEASYALMEDLASPEEVDAAMRLGTNYPHGPLEWADEIGLDEILSVLVALQAELGEERYRPSPLLRKHVYAGWTGRAAGRGFYRYHPAGNPGLSEQR